MPNKNAKNEKLVKDVMRRYGPVINLKEAPYLLIEILRHYGKNFDDVPDGGLPCAGVPPQPSPPAPEPPSPEPPGPSSMPMRNFDLAKQIKILIDTVGKMDDKINRLVLMNNRLLGNRVQPKAPGKTAQVKKKK